MTGGCAARRGQRRGRERRGGAGEKSRGGEQSDPGARGRLDSGVRGGAETGAEGRFHPDGGTGGKKQREGTRGEGEGKLSRKKEGVKRERGKRQGDKLKTIIEVSLTRMRISYFRKSGSELSPSPFSFFLFLPANR